MSYKKIVFVLFFVLVYFGINYAFLSTEGYTSMKDYIDSTKDEFSYDIEECETFGAFFDLMIESEICEIYDLPYLTHCVLTDPLSVCSHYPKLNS